MISKNLLSLLVTFLLFIQVRPNTFTVTTNADSGNGSLRWALQLASQNGSLVKDTILFNLPDLSPGGRTISIVSLLTVPANIIIDGSSQPGVKFGVSDAKVIIQSAIPGTCQTGFFIQNVNTIGIYGLWMKDFSAGSACKSAVIYLHEVSGIQIGAPSKGNLFSNNSFYTILHDARDATDPSSIHDVTIQSNIFDLDTTGTRVAGSGWIHLGRSSDVLFGGDTEAKGNYVANSLIQFNGQRFGINRFYHFSHNKLGLNYSKTAKVGSAGMSAGGGSSAGEYMLAEIRITDNECSNMANNGNVFSVNYFKTDLIIENNQIGLFNNSTGTGATGIDISICEKSNNLLIRNNVIRGFSGYGIRTSSVTDVTITNNSIYCNRKGIYHSPLAHPPDINITNRTDSFIKGTASAGSTVEVFSTNTCYNMCLNGETLLGSVAADAAGTWQLNATNSGNISATATSLSGFTSEFNKIDIDISGAIVKNATCGQNNGSIKNVQILNAGNWHWEDASANIISTDTNLVNVGAGFYKFVVPGSNVACESLDTVFEIKALPAPIFSNNPFIINHPSCNKSSGKIKFIDARANGTGIIWLDQNLLPVLTGMDSVQNLMPGTYYCKLYLVEDTACKAISIPIILSTKSGPAIDVSSIQIKDASCGNPNGSIANINFSNVAGASSITWTDAQNNIVGSAADLLNAPAGRYRLKFKDASGCDTMMSPYYVINNLGNIIIDQSNQIVKPAKCSGNTGSVSNIVVSGGDTYEWRNTLTNSIAGNTMNVFNLPAGNYGLTVRNNFGCEKNAAVVIIPATQFITISVSGWYNKSPNCGQPNGIIRIDSFRGDSTLYNFYWVDSTTRQTVGTGTLLTGIDAGTYFLFAIESNGCEKQIYRTIITAIPKPGFDYGDIKLVHDKCAMGSGSITQLRTNDTRGPADYAWLDANNSVVANTINIQNLHAGSYRLQATDRIQCTITSEPIIVLNTTEVLMSPQCDDQFVLRNTATTLKVRNAQPGSYQLLDAFSATIPLQENTSGIFAIPPLPDDRTYYVRFVKGNCSSNAVAVRIKVVDKVTVYVPTGFTPNGDNKNDILKPVAYGPVTLSFFTVYNRWGQVVFTTNDFSKGWDGRSKGRPLESGVFVWMLKAKDEISGQWIEQKGTTIIIH